MNLKRTIGLALAGLVATGMALGALGVAPARAGRGVNIKGSDTMVILVQKWAEVYMGGHPGQVIEVTGGGSGVGIASLINGTTQVCMASRQMKPDEQKKLRDRYQTTGTEIPVARDGVSIYVNASNALKDLTLAQIRDIYTGKITNWKEVGGKDAIIVLYGRENSSGTYVFFKERVLEGADYSDRCQTLPGTAAVVNAVLKDPNGIGYGGAAYAKGIRELPVKKDAGATAYTASPETIKSGQYPVSRFLYFYTRTKPAGEAKAFIDWVLSAEGQKVVSDVGYFPLN